MSELKAIDTEYKGYRFRSRLEARWAVYFDSMQIQYEYEPEGFQVGDATAYLPDFYLPELSAYVEIKPANTNAFEFEIDDEKHEFSMSGDGIEKYAQACNCFADAGYMFLLLCGDPVDVLYKNHGGNGAGWIFERMSCLVQLAKSLKEPIPWDRIECEKEKCESCNHHTVMSTLGFAGFASPTEFLTADNDDGLFPVHLQYFKYADPTPELKEQVVKNLEAAKHARQARFEFGEK